VDRPPKILRREIRGLSKKGDADYEEFNDENVEDLVDDEDFEPEVYTESDAGLTLRSSQALSADSADTLSVLESLREFLEAERARSRNRALMLAAVFSVLLLLSIMGGSLMIERLRQQTGAHIDRLGRQQEETQGLQTEAARLLADITSKTRALETDLKHAGDERSAAETLMETQIERQLEGFQMVRKVLSEVEVENVALAREYRRMRTEWASFTNEMQASIQRDTPVPVAAVTAAKPVESATVSAPPEVDEPVEPVESAGSRGSVDQAAIAPPVEPWSPPRARASEAGDADHLDLAIHPRGSRRTIQWRLPLP
jgi:hypothetical protein